MAKKKLIKPILYDYEVKFYEDGPDTEFRPLRRFPGYEIGNKGMVISHKHYKKFGYHGYCMKQYGLGDSRYIKIDGITLKVKDLVKEEFGHHSNYEILFNRTVHGYSKIKHIPPTEEARANTGYAIFDNIHNTLLGCNIKLDMEGNVIEGISL